MEPVFSGSDLIGFTETRPNGRVRVTYPSKRPGREYRSHAMALRVLHMHHQEAEGRRFIQLNFGV